MNLACAFVRREGVVELCFGRHDVLEEACGFSAVFRVFRWLGLFPTHDYDLWNRTSDFFFLKKTPLWAFGIGPSPENVGKSQGQ